MASSSPAARLQVLSTAIVNIRGIIESMLRSVDSAESCLEDFRHRADREALCVLSEHLSSVMIDSGVLLESIAAAHEPLLALLDTPPSVT